MHRGNPPTDSQVITYGKPHCKSDWFFILCSGDLSTAAEITVKFAQTGSSFIGCTVEESFSVQ